MKGVDSRVALGQGDPDTCLYAYNLVPSELGLQVRPGYSNYASGIVVDPGVDETPTEVRSIIPFDGNKADKSDDRLFVATPEGLWDATGGGALTGTEKVATFGNVGGNSGWGVSTAIGTDNNEKILFYADDVNGLWWYDTVGLIWQPVISGNTNPGEMEGLFSPSNTVFITQHKQRTWLFENGSDNAWYSDTVGGIWGIYSQFSFGGKFKHGGSLAGLYTWAVEGGAGLDDFLVAVSTSGDVNVYTGSDPNDPSWSESGTYFIGQLPEGHRVGSQFGADLHLLSRYGVIAMSDLARGIDPVDIAATTRTYPIARFVREAMRQNADQPGWGINYIPSEGVFLINAPPRTIGTEIQFSMNLATGGWGFWRDVPMLSDGSWQGDLFFGTKDGNVMRMNATTDVGAPIEYSFLSSYQALGSPGVYKRGTHIRPNWVAKEVPVYDAKFLYDYNPSEIPPPGGAPVPVGAAWDSAIWDQAVWSAGANFPSFNLGGAGGIGRTLAVAIRGRSSTATTLVSVDLMWTTGGML
jgi:hypothetical protein